MPMPATNAPPPPFRPIAGDPTWASLRPALLLPEGLYRDYSYLRWDAFERDVRARWPGAELARDLVTRDPYRRAWRSAGAIVAEGLSWSWNRGIGQRGWEYTKQLAGAILPRN